MGSRNSSQRDMRGCPQLPPMQRGPPVFTRNCLPSRSTLLRLSWNIILSKHRIGGTHDISYPEGKGALLTRRGSAWMLKHQSCTCTIGLERRLLRDANLESPNITFFSWGAPRQCDIRATQGDMGHVAERITGLAAAVGARRAPEDDKVGPTVPFMCVVAAPRPKPKGEATGA